MTFKTLNLKSSSGEDLECEISSPWTAQLIMFDKYSNPIKIKHTSYTEEVLSKLFSVHHENFDALPVDLSIHIHDYDFIVNITTQY